MLWRWNLTVWSESQNSFAIARFVSPRATARRISVCRSVRPFPAALDPTLVLFALVLLTRPRALLSPAGWAALVLLLFSLNTRVQIGVRLLFPFVVFLHVALAAACVKEVWPGRWAGPRGPPAGPRRSWPG